MYSRLEPPPPKKKKKKKKKKYRTANWLIWWVTNIPDQNLMEVMHGKIETLEWKRKEKYFTNIYIRKVGVSMCVCVVYKNNVCINYRAIQNSFSVQFYSHRTHAHVIVYWDIASTSFTMAPFTDASSRDSFNWAAERDYHFKVQGSRFKV